MEIKNIIELHETQKCKNVYSAEKALCFTGNMTYYVNVFLWLRRQNQTSLPARAIRLADVTVHPCGQPQTSGKVQQDQKKSRGFPEGKSPLDPLSISPVKLKRNQKERQRYHYHVFFKGLTCISFYLPMVGCTRIVNVQSIYSVG